MSPNISRIWNGMKKNWGISAEKTVKKRYSKDKKMAIWYKIPAA